MDAGADTEPLPYDAFFGYFLGRNKKVPPPAGAAPTDGCIQKIRDVPHLRYVPYFYFFFSTTAVRLGRYNRIPGLPFSSTVS